MNQNWVLATQNRFEQALDKNLDRYQSHSKLIEAMRYSALNGGKRIRPLLSYATGLIFDVPLQHLDVYACALEMIHVYSLIHDDLPAMDNDSLRRGKPTCHIAFDEATAILAGDGLLTLAFNILARAPFDSDTKIELITLLSECAGLNGMLDGQMLDLDNENTIINFNTLKNIHARKTGAMIKASVLGGALCTGKNNSQAMNEKLNQLSIFADHLGLAFQIQDDVLDIQENSITLGKTAGKDTAQNKATYPALLGFKNAKQAAITQIELALSALDTFDETADHLRAISHYVITRTY